MNDCKLFLKKIASVKKATQDQILAYCIMPNHYHLLIRASTPSSIPKLMHRCLLSYAQYYNIKYLSSGHVFQGRYQAKLIATESYLLWISRYIHRNPLELDGITVESLHEYLWSSYPKYIGIRLRSRIKLRVEYVLKYFKTVDEYRDFCLADDIEARTRIKYLLSKSDPLN